MPRKASLTSDKADLVFRPFIVATTLEKEDAETRKLIRSHVMRGKNKGKKMPRAPQRSKADAQEAPPASRVLIKNEETQWTFVSPRNITSQFSLSGFSEEFDHKMQKLVHEAFTVVKPITYAILDVFGKKIDGQNDLFCYSNLSIHPAMVPSLLFSVQAFRDMAMGVQIGHDANFYLAKALHFLQKSINSKKDATSYATMVVITSLASASTLLGEFETAGKHLDGLHRVLEVRGGIESLDPGDMVVHKARTIDLGLAMGTGSPTRFAHDLSWSPQIAIGKAASHMPELDIITPRPDPRLLNIWVDLRELSRMANEAKLTRVTMPMEIFSRVSTSIPYRLVHLKFSPMSITELLRFCMMAYTKSLLVRIKGLAKRMFYMAEGLDMSLQLHTPATADSAEFLLWALFIATISIFEDLERPWLRRRLLETLSTLGLRTWPETRDVLKKFLWVDPLHDDAAKMLFYQLMIPRPEDIETICPAVLNEKQI
ncbi:hypothetical protein OQA88_13386 [Cercophora sp. LCS_1]